MEHTHKQQLLERLFNSHQSELVSYIRRKFRRPRACAEDITQDAFIRLQRLADLHTIENPRAHLYRTASNLAIDELRRERTRSSYAEAALEQEPELQLPPQRQLVAREQLEQMQAIVETLPDKCRRAFLLHRIHHYSYAEIADQLGVSVSSVEKYILRALKALRSTREEV